MMVNENQETEITQEFNETTDAETAEETNTETAETDTDKLQGELEKEKEKFLRLAAEFDNFRKRTANEKTQMYTNASAEVITELLPILDNFERSVSAESSDTGYKDGVIMIFNQFNNVLTKLGVEEIPALGEEFDPRIHNAVKQQASEKYSDNTVCCVFQKGYKYKDKIIRHSMVAVTDNS